MTVVVMPLLPPHAPRRPAAGTTQEPSTGALPPPPPPPPASCSRWKPGWRRHVVSLSSRSARPVAALLVYADKVRPLGGNELANEISRLGEPGEQPLVQMQLAMLLAQTRSPADLARALGLLQRVIANPANEAQALHPLARLLAARYQEQRRVEDDRERQAQQLRDSQRRIDQLTDRIEALRAIERSFSRPNNPPPVAPAAPKPAP
ncbi:hypothetical protein [Variovorax sp. WS11]|uniref:hypothetical protein n=1 Tax=Variovorax sp. WS11 TaxID=1105204 RepID=UPI001EF2F25D|nr:hypothetical protein [Variovorax sp. WS11]